MKASFVVVVFGLLLTTILAKQIFNGNFNDYTSSAQLDSWSWSNRVGEWETYIHGPQVASDWIQLSSSYKNPGDMAAKQGARIQINGSAVWNGQTMLRTEIIPEGFGNNQEVGVLYYQWSMKQTTQNQLKSQNEHQLVFFEAHFADIKYGGPGGAKIYFYVNGGNPILWSSDFTADTWFNFALQVDYNSKKVALYHSLNSNNLTQIIAPVSASVSQSDWHVGNLRLPYNGNQDPQNEWLFYSTITIQDSLLQPFMQH